MQQHMSEHTHVPWMYYVLSEITRCWEVILLGCMGKNRSEVGVRSKMVMAKMVIA